MALKTSRNFSTMFVKAGTKGVKLSVTESNVTFSLHREKVALLFNH
jgi:hypothetical protein